MDLNNTYEDQHNHELVDIQRISSEHSEYARNHLSGVIRKHISENA